MDELRILVEVSEEAGEIDPDAADMVLNVFALGDKKVRDCMVPRDKMSALDVNTPPEKVLEVVRLGAHTRMPVFDGTLDNVVGIVNTKDLFFLFSTSGAVVLEDATLQGIKPDVWARRAVAASRAHEADCIVVEVNQGGDLVRQVLAQVDASVPVRTVRASRGKWVRAEPVAALYARGLVAHVPGLTALEDELCAFGPDGKADGHSPDRVDALVWALTELVLNEVRPRVRGL